MRADPGAVPCSSWELAYQAFLMLPEEDKESLGDFLEDSKDFLVSLCAGRAYLLKQLENDDMEWLRNRLLYIDVSKYSEYLYGVVKGTVVYMAAVEIFSSEQLVRQLGDAQSLHFSAEKEM
tara:strand:- start:554 stop:916 length:363 start_codon:yes stop_codon:yes gene_type:complete